MKKLFLLFVLLVSTVSFAEQPGDGSLVTYKNDQKQLEKLELKIGAMSQKLAQEIKDSKKVDQDKEALNELQLQANRILFRQDEMTNSDCAECQANYYGKESKLGKLAQEADQQRDESTCYDCEAMSTKQMRRVMLITSPLSQVYWAELRKSDESQKDCVKDLEKGSNSAVPLKHDDANWLCKNRDQKEIAQMNWVSQQHVKYLNAAEAYSVIGGLQVVSGQQKAILSGVITPANPK